MKYIYMTHKRGLPASLEKETYDALRPILLKYLAMEKGHMSNGRIIGIMYSAFKEATIPEIKKGE